MYRTHIVAVLLSIISFVILRSADRPQYYSFSGTGEYMSISGDSVFLIFGIDVYGTVEIIDTMNIFTLEKIGKGFYSVTPVPMSHKDPFAEMSVTPVISSGRCNYVDINIHTPNHRDSNIVCVFTHDDVNYVATRKGRCFSVSIPSDHLDGMIEMRFRNLYRPVGLDGQYYGKLSFKTPLSLSDHNSDPYIESVEVVMPNLSYRTLYCYFVPQSYMRINRDGVRWFGGKWRKVTEYEIKATEGSSDCFFRIFTE